jgi:hypothetical protein
MKERKAEYKQQKINKQGGKRERKEPIKKSNKYSSFVSQDFSLTTSTDPSQFTGQLKCLGTAPPPPPTPPRLPDDWKLKMYNSRQINPPQGRTLQFVHRTLPSANLSVAVWLLPATMHVTAQSRGKSVSLPAALQSPLTMRCRQVHRKSEEARYQYTVIILILLFHYIQTIWPTALISKQQRSFLQ